MSSPSRTPSSGSAAPLLRPRAQCTLFRLSWRALLLLTLGPLLLSVGAVFLVGFAWDYKKLLNYEWTCGRVILPSLSRIINLPAERVLWHLGMMLHAAWRPIYLLQGYLLNRRVQPHLPYRRLLRALALATLVAGAAELLFSLGLTVIGERESGPLHVYFFVGFIVSCTLNFIMGTICFRCSETFERNPQFHWHFGLRIFLTVSLLMLIPLIFFFFVLYWQECVNFAYDVFAALEYLTILVIYLNHIATFWSLRGFGCRVVSFKRT